MTTPKYAFKQSGLKIRRIRLTGGILHIELWDTQKAKVLQRVAKSLGLVLVDHGEDATGTPYVQYAKPEAAAAD